MFENEEQLKQRLAVNIAYYRELFGDTQLELAEKLNYSDKSVSKWERGEGIPGVFVLTRIADCYGISVADLLAEKPGRPKKWYRYNRVLITLISLGLVWLVATAAFIILSFAWPEVPAWYAFLGAIPVTAVVAVVFSCMWWHRILRFISVSGLIWGIVVCLVITVPRQDMWLFYILAGVVQILTILWFLIKKQKKTPPPPEEPEV